MFSFAPQKWEREREKNGLFVSVFNYVLQFPVKWDLIQIIGERRARKLCYEMSSRSKWSWSTNEQETNSTSAGDFKPIINLVLLNVSESLWKATYSK